MSQKPELVVPGNAQVQQAPTYPTATIQFTPDGVVFSILFSPSLAINQAIAGETMDEMCRAWREHRKQQQNQLALVHDVMRTKH